MKYELLGQASPEPPVDDTEQTRGHLNPSDLDTLERKINKYIGSTPINPEKTDHQDPLYTMSLKTAADYFPDKHITITTLNRHLHAAHTTMKAAREYAPDDANITTPNFKDIYSSNQTELPDNDVRQLTGRHVYNAAKHDKWNTPYTTE